MATAPEVPAGVGEPLALVPPLAPMGRRCTAGLIDLVPCGLVIVPTALWLGQGGFILGMALAFGFLGVCEARWGQTPGKRLLGLRTLYLDGSPVGRLGAGVRNAFRVIDAFPGCYLIGLVSAAGSRRRQRIGDQAAGTSVYLDAPGVTPGTSGQV